MINEFWWQVLDPEAPEWEISHKEGNRRQHSINVNKYRNQRSPRPRQSSRESIHQPHSRTGHDQQRQEVRSPRPQGRHGQHDQEERRGTRQNLGIQEATPLQRWQNHPPRRNEGERGHHQATPGINTAIDPAKMLGNPESWTTNKGKRVHQIYKTRQETDKQSKSLQKSDESNFREYGVTWYRNKHFGNIIYQELGKTLNKNDLKMGLTHSPY